MKTSASFVRCNFLSGRGLRAGFAAAFLGSLVLLVMLVPQRLGASSFPAQGDDTTSSVGVFRVMVEPGFRALLAPTGIYNGYNGYRSADGRLTSPSLADEITTPTVIGRSDPHSRPNVPPYTYFPENIGAPAPAGWDSVGAYADYPAIPLQFSFFAANNTVEVLTEIRSFILKTSPFEQCTNDPRIPLVPPGIEMVKAGTDAGVWPRSLGMLQENSPTGPALGGNNFPARSFFDVFVEITLPVLPGTYSTVSFPPTGAVLTNELPLVITNLDLGDIPPRVVYIHGDSPVAVPIRFKNSWPGFYNAGDLFGSLVLAGHGTYSNDYCYAESALLRGVLGPPGGAPMPEMPPEWQRPNPMFPSPGSAYATVPPGTNGEVQIADVVRFTVPGQGTFYARNLRLSDLHNPIPPPPMNGSSHYSNLQSRITCDLSLDNVNFFPAEAVGLVGAGISFTNPPSSPVMVFDTEMLQLNLSGTSVFGPFFARESPSKRSLGKHTIRNAPPGFRVSSFFDVFLEVSTDGINWIPADRAVRMLADAPPAAPGSIYISRKGREITLQWLGTFQLQSSTSLPDHWVDVPGVMNGPYVITATEPQRFFQLRGE